MLLDWKKKAVLLGLNQKGFYQTLDLNSDRIPLNQNIMNQVTYLDGKEVQRLRSLLRTFNSCSTGLSHGEYYSFMRMLTFIFRAVWNTDECLCIEALSIRTTMFLFAVYVFNRSLFRVRYRKFSKRTASVPPSNNCIDNTLSCVIAASKEKLYCPTCSFGLFLCNSTISCLRF